MAGKISREDVRDGGRRLWLTTCCKVDRQVRSSLTALVADGTAERQQGKRQNSLKRFAMGCLVGVRGRHHFLEYLPQTGIEILVAQSSRVGVRPPALTIWSSGGGPGPRAGKTTRSLRQVR